MKTTNKIQNRFSKEYAANQILNKVDYFLSYFNIKYTHYPNRVAFTCPIHGSDNIESACIFKRGTKYNGNFQCWTHHCENHIGYSIYDFFKYLLKKKRIPILMSG